MKQNKILLAVVSICIIIIFTFLIAWGNGRIGVSSNRIEEDARKSQKINENWKVAKDVTDEMGILMFYDTNVDKQVFSVYTTGDPLTYGYIFKSGGTLGIEKSQIQGFSYEGKGMALVSMNGKGIEAIKVKKGTEVETIQVVPNEPFAVIIPTYVEEVVGLYNSKGESIAIDNIRVN
ncbi:MAG: hypothetical protein RR817_10555 [Niameybacter sp.]